MNLLPHKRTLCLSNLTGSLSRLVSSTTGVKCQCSLFNQCFILGLYFNTGMKWQLKCRCRYIFCPFEIPGPGSVNLNNLKFIFNLYKSLREMCDSFAKRHNSCADKTPNQDSLPPTKEVIVLLKPFFFFFF